MKNKTMNDIYRDGSEHIACSVCGLCKDCGDCECQQANNFTDRRERMSEQEEFENIVFAPPYEKNINKYDGGSAWPDQYRDYSVQFAWEMWQACAERKDKEIARRDIIIKLHASIIEQQAAEIAALRELLYETQLFINELPKDLGKGSLNGWKIQIIQKIIDKRGGNE